ncbi:MAG: NADH:flavin oxidoreductase/NADH oxidase family protein [Phyllobacteriaceae bacterium]|nr:NADH:flavin oxidoreductase/NADH oxidase family protein [Phyllobacteriaceae bacterium]
MTTSPLFQPLTLPNGVVLKNRIAKAAMEENLADGEHAPGGKLRRLYKTWAAGGAGLIITGNVMVDAAAMTGHGGVVVEDREHLHALRKWAKAGRGHGARMLMQINHPGRQMRAALGQQTIAPSAPPLEFGQCSGYFSPPREMTDRDIQEVIARFVETAGIAEDAGFGGVEIHAAHGHLLNQFLSPLTNRRTDQWGGALDNRARPLVEITRRIRKLVARDFCVAVKINSADFQPGGFDIDDAMRVVGILNDLDVDLIDISGGNFESPAMQGRVADGRTLAREADFLEFAKEIRTVAKMPIMLTGGIRDKAAAEKVIGEGVSIAGMATALAFSPDLPHYWAKGEPEGVVAPGVQWKNMSLAALAARAVTDDQLQRLGRGKAPKRHIRPAMALVRAQARSARSARKYARWFSKRAEKGGE